MPVLVVNRIFNSDVNLTKNVILFMMKMKRVRGEKAGSVGMIGVCQ